MKQQKLEPLDLKRLSQVIAMPYTGEQKVLNYLSGEQLVDFYNALGFKDDYIYGQGGIIADDFENCPSRPQYSLARLRALNNDGRIVEVVSHFLAIADDKQKAHEDISRILNITHLSTHIEPSNSQKEAAIVTDLHRVHVDTVFDNVPDDHPIVFISYSWDDEAHRLWVKQLADNLTHNGVYVFYDGYLPDGFDLVLFMRQGIKRADKVLIIGTPMYKEKLERNSGGARFEDQIINAAIYHDAGSTKFIPLIRRGTQFDDSFAELIEIRKGYDFRLDENYDVEFQRLLKMLWGVPENKMPRLGNRPSFLDEECQIQKEGIEEVASWDRLLDYASLSNQEAIDISNCVIRDLANQKLTEPTRLGNTVAILSFMMANDIIPKDDDIMNDLIDSVVQILQIIPTRNELYSFKIDFAQGVAYFGNDNPVIASLLKNYLNSFDSIYGSSKDIMTIRLENLSDETAVSLIETDEIAWPDRSILYANGPVFQYCDPEKVAHGILKLSNAGRTSVSRYIISHYKLSYVLQGEKDYCFTEDVPVLNTIVEILKTHVDSFIGNDRFTLVTLIKKLEQAISRCNGSRNNFN